jgi:hypothetical protein
MTKKSVIAIGIVVVMLALTFFAVALMNQGSPEVGFVDSASPTPNVSTSSTATLMPTDQSTPAPTSNPTLKPTVAPAVTPGPTGMLPDDVKINYQECSRTYNQTTNTTLITLQIQVISDLTTRSTFILFEKNFYLKESDAPLSTMDSNSTAEIIVNEDRQTLTAITFSINGDYTGNTFELAYSYPPDLIFYFKKL